MCGACREWQLTGDVQVEKPFEAGAVYHGPPTLAQIERAAVMGGPILRAGVAGSTVSPIAAARSPRWVDHRPPITHISQPSMFKLRTVLVAVVVCAGAIACASPEPAIESDAAARLDTLAPAALSYAADHYLESATRLDPADGIPRRATDSTDWEFVSVNDWTSGFFEGVLWQLADYSDDPDLRAQAHRWTLPLEGIFDGHYDHDLGFQFFRSRCRCRCRGRPGR